MIPHPLSVVFEAGDEVRRELALISDQEAKLRVLDRRVVALRIIARVVVSNLGAPHAAEAAATRAAAHHGEPREESDRTSRCRHLVGRERSAAPETAIRVKGQFGVRYAAVESQRRFDIVELRRRLVGLARQSGERIELKEATARRQVVRPEKSGGHDNQLRRESFGLIAGIERIDATLEVFHGPAGEERRVVLGENVVDEHEIADAPGDDLATDAHIPGFARKIQIAFAQVRAGVPVGRVVKQLGLRQQAPSAAARARLQFQLESLLTEHEAVIAKTIAVR